MVSESANAAPLEFPQPEAPADVAPPPTLEWNPVRKILFRFSFLYYFFYCFPFPLTILPFTEAVLKPYQWIWDRVVPMVGWMAFRIDSENRPSGSGDTTFDWMQLFTLLLLSTVGTAIWTWLGRRQTAYPRLQVWLRTYVRFFLAGFMISYGAAKAIKSQFAFPSLDELLQPIGESSPMGLVWDFMGASTAYTMFSGIAEMLGGVLLAFRRTALLGALVSIGAMLNVLMLNLCFDVPVKLFSAHLLIMGVFLTLPHLGRLVNLLVLNRRVEKAEEPRLFASPKPDRIVHAALAAFLILFAGWSLYGSWQDSRQYGDLMPRPPLYGIWTADELVVDGVARPPLLTDATRWRYLVFSYPEFLAIRLMDSSSPTGQQFYKLKVDEAKRTLALTKYKDPRWRAVLTYRKLAPDVLELEGTMDGQKVRSRLRRMDENRFMLVSRGFHWVNEYPINH